MFIVNLEYAIGDEVIDDLTCKVVKVIGAEMSVGKVQGKYNYAIPTIGYWIDDKSIGEGGRHPWELTKSHKGD